MTVTELSRRAMLVGLTTGSAVGLVGCTGGGDNGDENREITIALAADPTDDKWDTYGYITPYFTRVIEPLVWATEEMEPTPWLAEEWEAIDETTWVFTLREDVTFHNGESLTAEDVVYSFERVFDRGEYVHGWLHLTAENVVAPDDQTVEFTTTEPFPAFPGTIAHNMIAIQHPESEDHSEGVVGTGPFQTQAVERGQHIEVDPFDDYWGETVDTSPLLFEVIEDPNTRALSLGSEEVDVIFDPPRSRVASLRDDSETSVETQSRRGLRSSTAICIENRWTISTFDARSITRFHRRRSSKPFSNR